MNTDRPDKIPSLDGIRAIAILLVLLDHVARRPECMPQNWSRVLFYRGTLGVQIFFVLSGYLITTLLAREHVATGQISLRDFYLRRAFRILPAYLTYILAILVLQAFHVLHVGNIALAHAFTFTTNFQAWNGDWWVAHLWSLSVEEQFYIAWPVTLWLLGLRRGLIAVCTIVLVCPCVRLGWFLYDPVGAETYQWTTPFVADAIAFGCLTALVVKNLFAHRLVARALSHRAVPIVALIGLSLDVLRSHPKFYWFVGTSLVDASAALLIVHTSQVREGWVIRVLNQPVLVTVGLLSYSIYLWQQLFLNSYANFGSWAHPPLNLILTLVAAALSFRLVETPFLALRRRIEARIQTPVRGS